MSGHSHSKNVASRKEKMNAQKSKLFSRFAKDIMLAVKSGGKTENA